MFEVADFFRTRLAEAYGTDGADLVLSGLEEAPARPTTLRVNTLRATRSEIEAALDEADLPHGSIPWFEDALVLEGVDRSTIWDLDIFKEGLVYMQSLSSMIPPLVMELASGTDVLDMCAAPGGKTSEIAALSNNGVHLTACEMHAPRADKLEFNLARLGAKNVNVMRIDARRLDEFFSFDEILLDAPCTGSGTLNPQNQKQLRGFTEVLLKKCKKSQQALLDRALTVLKPGGTLIYSTCSVLPEENEEQVKAALASKRHRDCELKPFELDPSIPQLKNGLPGTVTVCPTRNYEGFFLAKIKKSR